MDSADVLAGNPWISCTNPRWIRARWAFFCPPWMNGVRVYRGLRAKQMKRGSQLHDESQASQQLQHVRCMWLMGNVSRWLWTANKDKCCVMLVTYFNGKNNTCLYFSFLFFKLCTVLSDRLANVCCHYQKNIFSTSSHTHSTFYKTTVKKWASGLQWLHKKMLLRNHPVIPRGRLPFQNFQCFPCFPSDPASGSHPGDRGGYTAWGSGAATGIIFKQRWHINAHISEIKQSKSVWGLGWWKWSVPLQRNYSAVSLADVGQSKSPDWHWHKYSRGKGERHMNRTEQ